MYVCIWIMWMCVCYEWMYAYSYANPCMCLVLYVYIDVCMYLYTKYECALIIHPGFCSFSHPPFISVWLYFQDYDCKVEFYTSPYLVDQEVASNATQPIIRLDRMDRSERRWRKADVLVFNTGHWWTPDKIGDG